MNKQLRVMLLIDADNVSADVIEQAVEKVHTAHGAIHVRRAYCTAESALANLRLFKAHSIRPIVNLSTGKNSTDIALAVDAVDLVITERPDLVVIVSSDSDFAPLVIKLREKGCRVEGIGQLGKTGEDSKPVYDDFTDIAHRKARGAAAAPASAPRKRARQPAEAAPLSPPKVAEATAPATMAAPAAAPASPPPSAAAPARKTSRARSQRQPKPAAAPAPAPVTQAAPPPPPPPPAPMPDDLRRILAVLPELARGGTLELGIAAERLRSEEMLKKKASSTKLFGKYPQWFALTPEGQPNKVQFLGFTGA